MKTAIILAWMAIAGSPASLFAQVEGADPSASEILSRMDEAMNFPEGTMVLSFEDAKEGKPGRKLEARVLYSLEAGTLVEFVSPEREKGKRVLMIGDSMWMGSPAVSRPVRLSGKDSFMGTSFTNDDVMNFTREDDYEARLLAANAEGWTLELAARKKSLPYPRMVVEVDRAYLPVHMVMYVLSGQEAKRIEFGNVRSFEGKMRPATMAVSDAMAAGNRTIVEFRSITAGAVDRSRLSPASFMK